jgi:hypothetical protein
MMLIDWMCIDPVKTVFGLTQKATPNNADGLTAAPNMTVPFRHEPGR